MQIEETKFNSEEQDYPVIDQAYQYLNGTPSPDIQSLIHEAKNFKILYEQFKQQPFFSVSEYYLLSKKWLRRWKVYVSYNQCVSAAPPNKLIGKGSLPKINENLVKATPDTQILFDGELDYLNITLKQGLQQQKDYIFISEDLWAIFRQYQHIKVRRPVHDTVQGKKVELYFQQLTLIPIFSELLKSIEHEKCNKLPQIKLQVSHYITINEVENLIRYKLKKYVDDKNLLYYKQLAQGVPLRMWLLPDDTRPNILLNQFLASCKANATFTYKLYSEGNYMQPEKHVCDFDIFSNSLILVEMKESKQPWVFWNSKRPYFGECSNCKSREQLKVICSCKCALYCTKKCKNQDKTSHKYRCPNECESDQEQIQIKFNDHSRYGLVGLRNLGNTCFMNSGLQCLSHVTQLTNYFLSDKYLTEINKQNPLGTKGELSTAYGKMLKSLWMGCDSSFSPTQFKRAIGKYQPMFMGYNQHDSGQFVSFLLDGLHEDLNRVIQKPYVETKDYDGRPDFIIAKQAWQNHLKRNKSVVTDLMFGQFKSIVDCPKCQYESIQFDPFLMCTLPLVNDNIKKIDVIFQKDQLTMTKINISYDVSSNWLVSNLLSEVKSKLNLDFDVKLLAYATSVSGLQIIEETQRLDYVRKQKIHYKKLFVREKKAHQDPENDVAIAVAHVYCNSHYGNQSYRKNITPYFLWYFKKTATFKQIHDKIYSAYQQFYPIQNYVEQVINVPEKEQPFRLLTVQQWKYNSKCVYCSEKGCQGCFLPYDQNRKLSEYVTDDKSKIQMQFYWRKNDKEVRDKFEEIFDNIEKQDKNNKLNGTTIDDCFKLFEEPEILAEDNAWYCPKCQDFVLAKKQMQIYKAPKVLIICLKRFKRKQYFSEKYNILVDFPINGLNITDYVMNHNLPNDYSKGQSQQNSKRDQLLYDLVGITNHFGGTGGGHYTAYCKDEKSQKWYDFDDSYVSELKSVEDAVTESAYMLYYKRRE